MEILEIDQDQASQPKRFQHFFIFSSLIYKCFLLEIQSMKNSSNSTGKGGKTIKPLCDLTCTSSPSETQSSNFFFWVCLAGSLLLCFYVLAECNIHIIHFHPTLLPIHYFYTKIHIVSTSTPISKPILYLRSTKAL